MNEPNPQQWFQARLRWAVMEEASGLNHWREAEHIFLSENRQTAWQQALQIGRQQEHSLLPLEDESAPVIDCRFAEIVYLEELGAGRTAFEVDLGKKKPRERLGFDHQFEPASRVPPPMF